MKPILVPGEGGSPQNLSYLPRKVVLSQALELFPAYFCRPRDRSVAENTPALVGSWTTLTSLRNLEFRSASAASLGCSGLPSRSRGARRGRETALEQPVGLREQSGSITSAKLFTTHNSRRLEAKVSPPCP